MSETSTTDNGHSAVVLVARSVVVVVLLAIGFTVIIQRMSSETASGAPAGPKTTVAKLEPAPLVPPPIDPAELRAGAWRQIAARLDAADAASKQAIGGSLAGLDMFFAERRAGTKPFAEALLSLSGKWTFVKSKIPFADHDQHLIYLREQFEKDVFTPDQLRQAVLLSIAGYVTRVQGVENELLVAIRADLSDEALRRNNIIPALSSEVAMRKQFDAMSAIVVPAVGHDLGVAIGRETTSLVAGEVAMLITVRVGTAVATRLGVSGGILGAGAGSSWATFGVGLIAAIVVDAALDRIIRAAGYDAQAQLAEHVGQTLDQLRATIASGHSEAVEVYGKLRAMQTNDSDAAVRDACRKSADRIERSGNLGVQYELNKLHEQRSAIRREALRRLILLGASS